MNLRKQDHAASFFKVKGARLSSAHVVSGSDGQSLSVLYSGLLFKSVCVCLVPKC